MAKGLQVIDDAGQATFKIVVWALLIGSFLGATAFSSITIINITALQEEYGAGVTTFIGFLGLVFLAGAINWAFGYFKNLTNKKGGLMSAQ